MHPDHGRLDDAALARLMVWLDRACEGDDLAGLRADIAAEAPELLVAFERGLLDSEFSPLDSPVFVAAGDDAPGWLPGQRLGPWRIVELAGQGGMGEVYRAERADLAFERIVAIKRVRIERVGFATRFQLERELLARLDHPSIARLLDGGVDDQGRPYLVMEWVQGLELGDWLLGQPELEQRLDLLEQLGEALVSAHRSLVIHRDLKPANVRVTAAGSPKLLDFGIAKLVDPAEKPGDTIGLFTPQYAAPEQLRGQPVSTLTDVHGFGLLMFEVLAGRPAYPDAGRSLADAVRVICEQDAPRPSAIADGSSLPYPARRLEGDLDAIVAHCLAKEPLRRYNGVSEALADLRRYRGHHPILARQDDWRYRGGRWLRRHWLPSALATLVLLSLLAGLQATLWQARVARQERDQARRESAMQEALREHFMLVLGEAAESQSSEVRRKLDLSVAEIDRIYPNDPDLRHDLVLAIGELYYHIGDYLKTRDLLLRLRQTDADLLTPVQAVRLQVLLAQVQVRLGELDSADRELVAAESGLAGLPGARVQRFELDQARSQWWRAKGETARGLALQRQAVAELAAAPEATVRHIGIAQSNLATALLQAGDLDGSESSANQALATWQRAGLPLNSNLPVVLTLLGHLANLRGQPLAALERYDQATAATRASETRTPGYAALLNARARALLSMNRLTEADPLAVEAESILIEVTGKDSPDRLGVVITRADLAIANQRWQQAQEQITEARRIAGLRLPPGHPIRLRVDLAAAELLARSRPGLDLRPEFQRIAAALADAPAMLGAAAATAEQRVAEAALRTRDHVGARAALQRADRHLAALQKTDGVGRLQIAYLLALSNDDPAAAERSLRGLQGLLGKDHPDLHALTALAAQVSAGRH
ncbi:MAG: protein kinase [Lysobacterales bacterium]